MKGKRYLVTGGASGVGRAVAAKLTAMGAEVIIWGRRRDRLEAAVGAGIAKDFCVVDVSDPTQVESGFSTLKGTSSPVAGVVHSAGIWTPGMLVSLDPQTIIDHILVVTVGAVLIARAAALVMQDTGGHIVLIASAAAKAGYGGTALNTLAKRAVDGLQEGFGRELRQSSIRLTTIYPDSIDSDTSEAVLDGLAMTYDDVANAVLFALQVDPTVHLEEMVLTAPKTGR